MGGSICRTLQTLFAAQERIETHPELGKGVAGIEIELSALTLAKMLQGIG